MQPQSAFNKHPLNNANFRKDWLYLIWLNLNRNLHIASLQLTKFSQLYSHTDTSNLYIMRFSLTSLPFRLWHHLDNSSQSSLTAGICFSLGFAGMNLTVSWFVLIAQSCPWHVILPQSPELESKGVTVNLHSASAQWLILRVRRSDLLSPLCDWRWYSGNVCSDVILLCVSNSSGRRHTTTQSRRAEIIHYQTSECILLGRCIDRLCIMLYNVKQDWLNTFSYTQRNWFAICTSACLFKWKKILNSNFICCFWLQFVSPLITAGM